MCSRPLLMARREWERLCGARGAGDGGAAERASLARRLDAASREMTRKWPNSVESVNRRLEEARAERRSIAERDNELFLAAHERRERAERARQMGRARDRIFQDKDAPKTLLRAVIECATLKERDLQLQFKKQLKKEQVELDRENDELILGNAKSWHDEKKIKARLRYLSNKEHQKEISRQIKDRSECTRLEREQEIFLEQKDDEKAKQQMAEIKDFEEKYKLAQRDLIKTDMKQAAEDIAQKLKEKSERDALDEKLRQSYLEYKHRVDCRRAQTDKEIQKQKLRMQENICKQLDTGSAAREQEIEDKAVREREALEEERRLADEQKIKGLVQDRKEQRRKFLEDEKQRRHREDTLKTWSVLNRFKNKELMEEFEKKQREQDRQRTLGHREDLIQQCKEHMEREEIEMEDDFYELTALRVREADDKLLRHAALLREEARAAGRPTRPLDRAVEAYRRKHELHPAPALPASQQEHFARYAPEDRAAACPDQRRARSREDIRIFRRRADWKALQMKKVMRRCPGGSIQEISP